MYAIELIELICIESLQLRGDRVYISQNNTTIWSTGRKTLHNEASARVAVNLQESASAHLILKSHQRFWRDNYLGEVTIRPNDAERGEISMAMVQRGAHYLLKYRVTQAESTRVWPAEPVRSQIPILRLLRRAISLW